MEMLVVLIDTSINVLTGLGCPDLALEN